MSVELNAYYHERSNTFLMKTETGVKVFGTSRCEELKDVPLEYAIEFADGLVDIIKKMLSSDDKTPTLPSILNHGERCSNE